MQTQPIPEITPEDIQQNKTMAILGYIIFLIPLLGAKDSKYARYHANQAMVLQLSMIAIWIVSSIISSVFFTMGGIGAGFLITGLFSLVSLALGVLDIIGLVYAAQGKVQAVPVLGNITILK